MSDRIHDTPREANNQTAAAGIAADAYDKTTVQGGGNKGGFDADPNAAKHLGPGPHIVGMESGTKPGCNHGGHGLEGVAGSASEGGGAGAHGGNNLTKHMEVTGLKH